MKARQSICRCFPTGEAHISGDEPRQSVAHVSERACRLHESAQWKTARKVSRCCHDEGHHHRDLSVAGGEPREPSLSADDGPRVREDGREAVAKAAERTGLAIVKRHALPVVPESGEAIAKIRLEALLCEVQRDEGL